ncbi:MAG: hypothetical protein Q7P63_11035 [Verrucomicrobiota bacterium JB022]|nr:hypothetical protein [Verrucomicrobiota bacterium JB022]
MALPKKFHELRDLEVDDVDLPDCVWIVYAVCGVKEGSCGWEGWIIDAPLKKGVPGQFKRDILWMRSTEEAVLPCDPDCRCPKCGQALYRTGVSLRMEPAADETPPMIPGVDYELLSEKRTKVCLTTKGTKHTKNNFGDGWSGKPK